MVELYWERLRGCRESWDDNSEWVEDMTPKKTMFNYLYSSWNNFLRIL